MRSFVDDFGDKTEEKHAFTVGKGYFSNSATTGSHFCWEMLLVNENEFGERLVFFLYDYCVWPADCGLEGYNNLASVRARAKHGEDAFTEYKWFPCWNETAGGFWLDHTESEPFVRLLSTNSSVRFVVKENRSSYHFTVPTLGFATALKQLREEGKAREQQNTDPDAELTALLPDTTSTMAQQEPVYDSWKSLNEWALVSNAFWQLHEPEESFEWRQAQAYCAGLVLGSFKWRLPTAKELQMLYRYAHNNPGSPASLSSISECYWTLGTSDRCLFGLAGSPWFEWSEAFSLPGSRILGTAKVRCVAEEPK